MRISFIVIGRNEGDRLRKCLQSIDHAINKYRLDAEMIYVDSQSDDASIMEAKKFAACRVFLLTGRYNSAIARNIGALEAIAEGLVFLDGDMELISEFVPLILNRAGDLKYDFVSGNFINHYYSSGGHLLHKDYYRKIYCSEDSLQPTTGGMFAIKRSIWNEIGGMRPMFKKGQDLDLGYRLASRGYMLLRKKEVMAHHHTIDYKEMSRLRESFQNGAAIYPRAILYRSNVFNKFVWKRMFKSDPTLLVLVVLIIIALIYSNWFVLSIYPVLTGLAVFCKNKQQIKMDIFERILIHILRDILNLLAFFFFYPSNKVTCRYEEV